MNELPAPWPLRVESFSEVMALQGRTRTGDFLIRHLFFCFFLTSGLCVADDSLGEGEELFVLAVNSKLLHELVHKPVSEQQSISENSGRVRVQGCIKTDGVVTAAPVISNEALSFQLILNSTTTIGSTNTTDGGLKHPEIGAQFQSTLVSRATTAKTVILREDGFAHYGATTAATTSMGEVSGIRVQAQGLLPGRRFENNQGQVHRTTPQSGGALPIPGRAIFPRLRARLAPEQVEKGIAEARAQTEADANARVTKSLNEEFNKTVNEALLGVHEKFLTYFYRPFIEKKMLGGRLGAGSDGQWLALRATRGTTLYQVQPSLLPGIVETGNDPLLLRFHPEFVERVAEMRFGGTFMTEVEAAEMMGYTPPDDETYENVMGQSKEEVSFVFSETQPIRLKFEEGKIYLTLRFSEAIALGTRLEKVQITRAIEIQDDKNGRIFVTMNPPTLPTLFSGRPIADNLARHIANRFGRLLAKDPIELSKRTLFTQVHPLRLKSLVATGNRLTAIFATAAGVTK